MPKVSISLSCEINMDRIMLFSEAEDVLGEELPGKLLDLLYRNPPITKLRRGVGRALLKYIDKGKLRYRF